MNLQALAPAPDLHPLHFLRDSGWLDYTEVRRIWIDPETGNRVEEGDAVRVACERAAEQSVRS